MTGAEAPPEHASQTVPPAVRPARRLSRGDRVALLAGVLAVAASLGWFGWQLARTVAEDRAVERGAVETPHRSH